MEIRPLCHQEQGQRFVDEDDETMLMNGCIRDPRRQASPLPFYCLLSFKLLISGVVPLVNTEGFRCDLISAAFQNIK